jgi:hypothetical protein
MLSAKKETATEISKFKISLTGIEIIHQENIKPYLTEIRNLVSCPDAIFRQLYLTTLYCWAEFCQAMPFSEDAYNYHYGFLERQLKLSIATLKLRRGILLPKNAGAEQISAEEAQWTYAIFSGSLLKDLYQLQFNREVLLHQPNGEEIGLWSPISGPPQEKGACYSMKLSTKKSAINKEILMAAFSGRIFSSDAIHWLSQNPYLFNQWWSVILHEATGNNDIERNIRLAAEKAEILLLDQSIPTEKPDLRAGFLKRLGKEITQSPEHVFRTNDGIFVSDFVIEDFLSENRFISKSTFFETLEKDNWLVLNEEHYQQELYPKKYEDKRILHSIILNIDVASEELQRLPIDTIFQKKVKKM